jgi:hypothetical protein
VNISNPVRRQWSSQIVPSAPATSSRRSIAPRKVQLTSNWPSAPDSHRIIATALSSSAIGCNLDPAGFILEFADRIYHVDCKDTRVRAADGRRGRLGSHLPWGDPRRGWDFVSTGHGDVPWHECFRALNTIGYRGPISIEWEDGAPEALAFVRRLRSTGRRQPSTPRSPTRRDGAERQGVPGVLRLAVPAGTSVSSSTSASWWPSRSPSLVLLSRLDTVSLPSE